MYTHLGNFWKKLLTQCLPIKKGSMDSGMGPKEDLNFSSYTILYCVTYNYVYLCIHRGFFKIINKGKIFFKYLTTISLASTIFFSGSATISIQWLLLSTQQLMHQAINLTTRTSLDKRKHRISFIKNAGKANCELCFGL